MTDNNFGGAELDPQDQEEQAKKNTPSGREQKELGDRLRRLVENSQEFAERLGDPSQSPASQTSPIGNSFEPDPGQGDPTASPMERPEAGADETHPVTLSSESEPDVGHPETSPFEAETLGIPAAPQPATIPVPTVNGARDANDPTIPPLRNESSGGFPLPNPVDEVDQQATRVTPAAFGGATRQSLSEAARGGLPAHGGAASRQNTQGANRYSQPIPVTRRAAAQTAASSRKKPATGKKPVRYEIDWGGTLGCLVKGVIAAAFVFVLALVFIFSIAIFRYFSIATTLPDVGDLKAKASQFETTRILDRDGNLLYEILDPNAGRRTYVTLDRISPYLVAATIATEDKEFYSHPGFDPIAITRALWSNYTSGETVSGASTITQQLARTLLMTAEERNQKTYERKAREIVLAAEITRRYTKDEILELYLNEFNYGNLAYGIEAASETYFKTSADRLSLAQSAFLAGLPQAPAVYDIFTNRETTLLRNKQVLMLMYELSLEQGCIEVSNSAQRVCVDGLAATEALKEIEAYPFEKAQESIRYPHWVNYIRSVLEEQYDPQTIYRSGFTVYTTLDPNLQDEAQRIVAEQVAALADHNARNGALVAIQPNSGEILAMVGSPNFDDDANSGQVNMATSPRQPGSSIKPLTYTAAFEKGWTPSTLIWDVPSEFPPSGNPDDPREPYVPVNYDQRFHGPVLARDALANSYNVPAVKTLNYVGIYDDPSTPEEDGFVAFARRLGITTLTREDYGLSLTLGGGDVSLLELTAAFSIYANRGLRVPPVAITKIVDYQGNVVFEHQPPQGTQVIRPEHAYLITSILSDNEARTPMFGANSALNLPFPVAAKTGTTNDFRDNWTLGFTPDLAVGVWVGNADYTPMVNTTGLTGAAPIWSQFMQFAVNRLTGGNPPGFIRPDGIVDKVICRVSGTEPSEYCSLQKSEIFAYDQLPPTKENDLWQNALIDTWTGLKSSPYCSEFVRQEFVMNVTDRWGVRWLRDTEEGRQWARDNGFNDPVVFVPERECKAEDAHIQIQFAGLVENQTIIANPLDIYALVKATANFKDFRLEYGLGNDPENWTALIDGNSSQYEQPERIYTWDLKDIPGGMITLRIYASSTQDTFAEKRIHLNIQVPTPTPTITPTPTMTNTPTPTETSTPTPIPPTNTPSPTETSWLWSLLPGH